MSNTVPVKTARKTLELLETIGRHDGADFSQLLSETEMSKSSMYDYLQTLEELGYVIEVNGNHHLASKFLELGEKRRRKMAIYRSARPELQKLAEETGEHASLMIEEHGYGVLLDCISGKNALQLDLFPGQRYPLPATAPGKAILAHLPDHRINIILEAYSELPEREIESDFEKYNLPTAPKNNLPEQGELRNELDVIREQGFATDCEEHVEGVRAIAAPVICSRRIHGAITIGGPAQRLTDSWMTDELPTMLLEAANVVEVNYAHL